MTTPIVDRRTMLKNFLKDNKVEVTFRKVNGETRVMNCTLCEDFIPGKLDNNIGIKPPPKINDNVLAVYDLDKNSWRSFRIDSIIETKLL